MKIDIAYLHGRPNPHPLHDALASSVISRRFYIDTYLRWHDKEKKSFTNLISWLVNALIFSVVIKEKYILVDGIHITTLFFKKFSSLFFRKRIIMAHLGSHTLYFLKQKKYSPISTAFQIRSLLSCDYLLCEGKMSLDLAADLLKRYKKKPVLIQTFLGVPTDRLDNLKNIKYKPRSRKIIILSSGPNEFREYYKGLDVMLFAFNNLYQKDNNVELIIVGDWHPHIKKKYAHLPSYTNIRFKGYVNNIEAVLSDASLCIQVTRGDAFPTSTIEVMTAGIPVILSDWTGTKQIIEKAIPEFIVSVDPGQLADKINWFFDLSDEQKIAYSECVKKCVQDFTQENAVQYYKEVINEKILVPSTKETIYFVHGRPGPHPLHKKYGASVSSHAVFVDPVLRWHDKNIPSVIRYFYWFVNALYFVLKVPHKGTILTEGVHITGLLAKKISQLISKKIFVTALMDDEFLYFLTQGYYKGASAKYNLYFVKQYDHFFCIGQMLYDLCLQVVGDSTKISKGFNGVNEKRLQSLLALKPTFKTNNIIFIGNGPSGWRAFYKGLDLSLQAFNVIASTIKDARLIIIGNWDKDFLESYIQKHCPDKRDKIGVIGQTNELEKYLVNSTIYLHPGRGEAWGISINEAMAAGIAPVVSHWTGASESVAKIEATLVVPLEVDVIASKVIAYLQQPVCQKEKLAITAKAIAAQYSESAAVATFENLFFTWYENK